MRNTFLPKMSSLSLGRNPLTSSLPLMPFFDHHIDQVVSRSNKDVFHTQWLHREIPSYIRDLYLDSSFCPSEDGARMECILCDHPDSHFILAYFLVWLCRAIFLGRDDDNVKAYSLLPACKLAWGSHMALCPTLVAKLCHGLRENTNHVIKGIGSSTYT